MNFVTTAWIPPRKAEDKTVIWIMLALLALTLAGNFFVAVLVWPHHEASFTVSPNWLVVHTKEGLWGDTTSFPLKGLRESKVVRVSGGTRLSGKQSAGYCAGWFTYPELGKVWQVTDCGEDVVLLAFSSGVRVLLAPQDPEAFLAAVSHRQQASFALRVNPQAKRGIAWDLVVLVLLLPIAIAVWVLALIHKGPARLAYAFEPGFLLVRTFALLKRFDLQGATAQVVEPRGLARLVGSGFPGYYVGLFWYQKRPIWVYASDCTRGILLEGKKRVFVTPEDEEAFLAMLREMGVSTRV